MKTETGIIIRFARRMPAFFNYRDFDAVRLIGRAFGGEMKDKVLCVEDGQCVHDVHTGVKTFDDRMRSKGMIFLTGNVVSDFQCSAFIRGHNNVRCNNFDFSPGHLRESDFKRLGRYGDEFRQWHKQNFSRFGMEETIGYVIRDGKGDNVVYRGWLITNTRGNLLAVKNLGTTSRSRHFNSLIMTEAVRHLTMSHLAVRSELVCMSEDGSDAFVKDAELLSKLQKSFPHLNWKA